MKVGKKTQLMIAMTVWLCITGAFLFWVEMDTRQEEKLLAQSTANAFFQQIVITRLWNASHGGVYVPITSTTPPNPYLPRKNRDLTADNGLKLTKVNPSYMTRQIAELAQKNEHGIQFHITSLKPIRPENKAMAWEEKWLHAFEQGDKEHGEFVEDGDITWFRYMAPLFTGPTCLPCHAQQGYKEGDIRGGLSVSMPYPTHTHGPILIGFGSVAIIGILFIFIGGTIYERKRQLFDATFNSPLPTCVTDTHHLILMGNEAYWAEFGPLPEHQKKIKCYEHRPGASCHTANCPLTRILRGSPQYTYEINKEKDGVTRCFIVTAKPLLDSKGRPFGCVENFQDITERKRSEEALADLNRKLEALSNTDALTAIANRRRFDEVLLREHNRHARSGGELSLIMLDLDHFKSFNDTYGHVKGDVCLQQIAQVITTCASRPADLAARYGGEEFTCILPETDRFGAIAVAEKIRRDIIARAIPHKNSPIAEYVTASLGVVTLRCHEGESVFDLIAQVDKLLYRAKSAGRNRVEFFTPSYGEDKLKGNVIHLAWKDSFCCGNILIDTQHKDLVDLSNELLEAILSGQPTHEISAIINRVLALTQQHFHDEEALLQTINFSGLDEHMEEHATLLAKAVQLSEQFRAATLQVGDVFQFLAYELVLQHMLEADRKFFPFLSAGGATDLHDPQAG